MLYHGRLGEQLHCSQHVLNELLLRDRRLGGPPTHLLVQCPVHIRIQLKLHILLQSVHCLCKVGLVDGVHHRHQLVRESLGQGSHVDGRLFTIVNADLDKHFRQLHHFVCTQFGFIQSGRQIGN